MSGETMRAVLVKNKGQSADDLYIGERPKPVPDSKEVLVKVSVIAGVFRGPCLTMIAI
jgi:NADPH:quinone reductase-like Zn-dependent oxidoreductase